MDLINRDIGKLAAILIDDTVDEHVMSFRKLSVGFEMPRGASRLLDLPRFNA
jgi:hypothetical protein